MVKNYLWEVANFSKETWETRVNTFFYHERARAPSMALGVSSYGTVQRFVDDNGFDIRLKTRDADLNTCCVIGSEIDEATFPPPTHTNPPPHPPTALGAMHVLEPLRQ